MDQASGGLGCFMIQELPGPDGRVQTVVMEEATAQVTTLEDLGSVPPSVVALCNLAALCSQRVPRLGRGVLWFRAGSWIDLRKQ
jgi:hypothetical protein